MGRLIVLCLLGDRTHTWNPKVALSDDPEAQEAVRQAERIFNEERARGAVAFRVSPDRTAERLDMFDPQAEQIVMVPRIAGG